MWLKFAVIGSKLSNNCDGRGTQIFAYANNHYAGNAPATVGLFRNMLGPIEQEHTGKTAKAAKTGSLFPL
jgi:hypothetical protein